MRLPQPTASIEHGSLARSLEHKGRICGAALLHEARHSLATVSWYWRTRADRDGGHGLVDDRMASRYQHVTDPIRREVAARVEGLLWASEKVK